MSNSFFTKQIAHFYCNNCIYNKWHEVDLVVSVFERYDIIAQYCQRYLTTNKYIQEAKIQYTESIQRQEREKTTILDQNMCKAILTNFAISK